MQVFCAGGGSAPDVGAIVHNGKGILSYYKEGKVQGLCAQGFNDKTAKVACYELYGSPDFISYTVGQQCTYNSFWIENIRCRGNEALLSYCQYGNRRPPKSEENETK